MFNRKNSRKFLGILGLILFFALPANAQERSYYYESISQNFTVHPDTTVSVEEIQTYQFQGEYHRGWRSIPLNKVSDITDVVVLDGRSGKPLRYSSSSLDKTEPKNWENYTYRKKGGNLEIEWYYNANNEERIWILKYTLVGALGFLKDKDELYWNLFTDYDVPIQHVAATVVIPGNTYSPEDLEKAIYVEGAINPNAIIGNNRTFIFSADNVDPQGIVTIAAGWPRGIVDRSAFWRQFLMTHIVAIISMCLILATLIIIAVYWYITEKRNKGRGTIVAEYDPPRNLPPAMAEVVVRESVGSKGWAATVVDLAVKGYVKITEEPERFGKVLKIVLLTTPIVIIAAIVFTFLTNTPLRLLLLVILAFIFVLFKKNVSEKSLISSDYIIETTGKDTAGLHAYEKEFLSILLVGGRFSTKEMRWDHNRGQKLYKEMKKLEKTLFEETERDTGVYEKLVSKDSYASLGLILVVVAGVFLVPVYVALSQSGNQGWMLPAVVGLCALAIFLFTKFEARLSPEGAVFREEWLGFKLYLKTAEKYRMQNLMPEIFEKYLPYAIIFGVEKQWGKAFEGISMPPPNWYHGAAVSTGFHGAGASSGFSASAFSSSFSSSFTSAFASSGGGGSGGGGSAGGGGGGGGGGAN